MQRLRRSLPINVNFAHVKRMHKTMMKLRHGLRQPRPAAQAATSDALAPISPILPIDGEAADQRLAGAPGERPAAGVRPPMAASPRNRPGSVAASGGKAPKTCLITAGR